MRKLIVVAAVAALAFAACGGDDDDASSSETTDTDAASTSGVEGSISVFAAASLTAAFEALGEAFTAANPDADVTFNFAASSELVTQIQEGAPADVFASADEANMQKLADANLLKTDPVVFAHNQLAIAVEPGNPLGITGLADLANSDLKVVLCAAEVPCGKYADQALSIAGVTVSPVSRGESVKATLAFVESGEADAAIVYVTDIAASDAVEGVEIPEAENVVATLPIAVLTESGTPAVAEAWIEFVTSADGQAVLAEFGFLP